MLAAPLYKMLGCTAPNQPVPSRSVFLPCKRNGLPCGIAGSIFISGTRHHFLKGGIRTHKYHFMRMLLVPLCLNSIRCVLENRGKKVANPDF